MRKETMPPHILWIGEQLSKPYTDKKGNTIFIIYKEIQNGAVAKSYMTDGLLIYIYIYGE
jgi:hypothetical protein